MYAILILGILAQSAFGEDRVVGGADGLFVIEEDGLNKRLLLAIWPDGTAIKDCSRSNDRQDFRKFEIGHDSVASIVSKLETLGVFDSNTELIQYGIPGASQVHIEIGFGSKKGSLSSCIAEFEEANLTIATSSGIALLDGQSIAEKLKEDKKTFILQRLVWAEIELIAYKSLLTAYPQKIIGTLVEDSDRLLFRYQSN